MNHFLSYRDQYNSVILNYGVNNGVVNVYYYQSLVLIIIMGVISKVRHILCVPVLLYYCSYDF